MGSLSEARAGAAAVAPMLIGVVPFGLVAGAAPVSAGLGGWTAVGFSTIVFAGASQLAAIDVLAHGGSAVVAIAAAWAINLRMVLYSASLAPFLGHVPTRARLGAAYVLTDQAYALSVARWAGGADRDRRLSYYLGAGWLLWASWQAATVAGALVGGAIPDDVPLDFAVPLVFLVLLVPLVETAPAVVAAVTGGAVAVVTAEMGGETVTIIVGALAGIAAGAIADLVATRSRAPEP